MDMTLAPDLSRVREQVSSAKWQQRVNLAACLSSRCTSQSGVVRTIGMFAAF
ncbi:hypothetical protein [Rhodoferax sp. BLA1]|uniref:hypothetical protein n=1 Tax=Rhodoferax sp. BLA1 TaxID=2576062 RepID=UPI0015D24D5B|nr:hypothetical protein [Rhodoferax sp. BLA1]